MTKFSLLFAGLFFGYVLGDLFKYGRIEVSSHGIAEIEFEIGYLKTLLDSFVHHRSLLQKRIKHVKSEIDSWGNYNGESVHFFKEAYDELEIVLDRAMDDGEKIRFIFFAEDMDGRESRGILDTILGVFGVGMSVSNAIRITETNNRLSAFVVHTNENFQRVTHVLDDLQGELQLTEFQLISDTLLASLTAKAIHAVQVLTGFKLGMQSLLRGEIPIEFMDPRTMSDSLKKMNSKAQAMGAIIKIGLKDFTKLPTHFRIHENSLFVSVGIPLTVEELELYHFKPLPIQHNQTHYVNLRPTKPFIAVSQSLTMYIDLDYEDIHECYRVDRDFYCERETWKFNHNFNQSCLGSIFFRSLTVQASQCPITLLKLTNNFLEVYERGAGNFSVLAGRDQAAHLNCGSQKEQFFVIKKGLSNFTLEQGCRAKVGSKTLVHVPDFRFKERLVINVTTLSLNFTRVIDDFDKEVTLVRESESKRKFKLLDFEYHPAKNSLIIAVVVLVLIALGLVAFIIFYVRHAKGVMLQTQKSCKNAENNAEHALKNMTVQCTHDCIPVPRNLRRSDV